MFGNAINLDVVQCLVSKGCKIPSFKQVEKYWFGHCSIVRPEDKKELRTL